MGLCSEGDQEDRSHPSMTTGDSRGYFLVKRFSRGRVPWRKAQRSGFRSHRLRGLTAPLVGLRLCRARPYFGAWPAVYPQHSGPNPDDAGVVLHQRTLSHVRREGQHLQLRYTVLTTEDVRDLVERMLKEQWATIHAVTLAGE